MSDGSHNTKLQTLFAIGHACQKATLRIIIEWAAQGVADLVGEGGDTGHLRDIGLDTQLFCGQSTLASAPALTIYK